MTLNCWGIPRKLIKNYITYRSQPTVSMCQCMWNFEIPYANLFDEFHNIFSYLISPRTQWRITPQHRNNHASRTSKSQTLDNSKQLLSDWRKGRLMIWEGDVIGFSSRRLWEVLMEINYNLMEYLLSWQGREREGFWFVWWSWWYCENWFHGSWLERRWMKT